MNVPIRVPRTVGPDIQSSGPEGVINLDANATAPVLAEVGSAVLAAMRGDVGNPSSGHVLGSRSRMILEEARDAVAGLVTGAFSEEVFFTSGCTEANNTVIRSALSGWTIISSAVEHSSVRGPIAAMRAHGLKVIEVPVSQDGLLQLDGLKEALSGCGGQVLVSVQSANSETGVLQPLAEIALMVAARPGTVFHSDAAQAFGRLNLCLGKGRGPDIITVSGHKLHAPMGVGAIIEAGGTMFPALLLGGGQEGGRRAGTQSVPLIAGFGAACQARTASFDADIACMRRLRDLLEAEIAAALPDIVINGFGAPRLPNTSNIRFPDVDAMALVANLDAAGIACSQGSACTTGRPEPSHVLMAMGLSEAEAFSSIRLSVSPFNTEREMRDAATKICSAARALRGRL